MRDAGIATHDTALEGPGIRQDLLVRQVQTNCLQYTD